MGTIISSLYLILSVKLQYIGLIILKSYIKKWVDIIDLHAYYTIIYNHDVLGYGKMKLWIWAVIQQMIWDETDHDWLL